MCILQLAYYLLDTQTDTGRRNTPPLPGNYPKLVAALLRIAEVPAGLAESNGSLPPAL